MSTYLHWKTTGKGPDLLLIHGWGMNSAVWKNILPDLSSYFTVHYFDLPGYGESPVSSASSLDDIVDIVLKDAPKKAIWLGWSLGGLIASRAVLRAPERITHLITVGSSSCFLEQADWRGIQETVLHGFEEQLQNNLLLTLERFLTLQALGSENAKHDIKFLKEAIMSKPLPKSYALSLGLDILAHTDLRNSLSSISCPWLRLYGRLDGLVPVVTALKTDLLAPLSQKHIFPRAAHAPFISHPDEFCKKVIAFIEKV